MTPPRRRRRRREPSVVAEEEAAVEELRGAVVEAEAADVEDTYVYVIM